MTNSVVSDTTVTVAAEITERCDRCGAAGKLRAFLPTGGELMFCGHHANRYAPNIRESAVSIVVESGFGWLGAPSDLP
jgi:hypothetical protein